MRRPCAASFTDKALKAEWDKVVDKIKLGFALLLFIAGIAGFYYLRDSAMVIRVLSVLTGIVLAVVVFWFTSQGKQFYAFSRESSEETRKVVWPNRKETMQTTGIVFAFVLVMAIFLWMVDAGLLLAVRYLMGQEA
ncbi:MAG: preprotein translocase subunit SecE [Nitrosospira sp.]|nr:preprotein translocase subunit SecE [Nitrosospira sp.]